MHEILTNRAIIKLSGENVLTFLQKLISNDILKNKFCYAYLLNNLGRYLFDFFVYKINDQELFIDISQHQAEAFISKIKFYILRQNIQIKNYLDEYTIVVSEEMPTFQTIYTIKDPRHPLLLFRSIIRGQTSTNIELSDNLYFKYKYDLAIPDGEIDLIFEKSIPIEYGAEELNAINYSKGCYIGQEVISRTKYQGIIRKKIFKIEAEEDLSKVEKNTEILINDTKIGIICSSFKNQGIGLIREENYMEFKDKSIKIADINIYLSIPLWRQNNN